VGSQPGTTLFTGAEFFADLDRRSMNLVVASAESLQVAAKHEIFSFGQPAARFFMVKTGRVEYYRVTDSGAQISLYLLTDGDIFGINALIKQRAVYQANAAAVSDCELLVWKKAAIRGLAAKHPQLAENALRIVLEYLKSYTERHINLMSKTAEQRIAIILLDLARRIGQPRPHGIEIEITNEQISNFADVTRFTTSRLLKTFERSGILSKIRGKVVIHAPEALAIG
jgi:CRP-like cAMP-binding protein